MTVGSGGISRSANKSSLVTTPWPPPGFAGDGDGKRIARRVVRYEFS
jgi:hypothetical protein